MERMMKVQEVILKAMAGKLKWWEAAEIIGISDRSMRRWRERYEEFGYDGLYDRRKGQPSPKRVALKTAEEVLRLYREKYFDFNVRHFHEKLVEEHGIELSYTWVKTALQGAGLVGKQRRRGKHRRRRPRRPLPGMMLHIDASKHAWFGDGRYYDLVWSEKSIVLPWAVLRCVRVCPKNSIGSVSGGVKVTVRSARRKMIDVRIVDHFPARYSASNSRLNRGEFRCNVRGIQLSSR